MINWSLVSYSGVKALTVYWEEYPILEGDRVANQSGFVILEAEKMKAAKARWKFVHFSIIWDADSPHKEKLQIRFGRPRNLHKCRTNVQLVSIF